MHHPGIALERLQLCCAARRRKADYPRLHALSQLLYFGVAVEQRGHGAEGCGLAEAQAKLDAGSALVQAGAPQ